MAFEYYNSRRHKSGRRKSYKPRGMGMPTPLKALIAICVIGICVYVGLGLLTDIDMPLFREKAKVTEVAATPKPTVHPLDGIEVSDIQYDVNITDTTYQWFSDGYIYNGNLIFCAGEVVGSNAKMTALMNVSTGAGGNKVAQRMNVVLENDNFMYPVFNENWLVFLDAKSSGGGNIVCYKYGSTYESPTLVKKVYTGHPALFLSGNYLAWTERTGTSMDKLFVCNLETLESVTVQMFNKTTYYGISKPHIKNNLLTWADVNTENSTGNMTSQICTLNVDTGEYKSYKPGMYAHDPKTNGADAVAWIDGNHGKDSDLYVAFINKGKNASTDPYGTPILVAEGIVDFYMDDTFIAYQKDEAIHIYILSTDTSYRITRNVESAQLMGAFDGTAVWCDVSSRERESVKFAKIPD